MADYPGRPAGQNVQPGLDRPLACGLRGHRVCLAARRQLDRYGERCRRGDGGGQRHQRHDQSIKGALQSATTGRYPDALAQLSTAAASVADAQGIATDLAKVGDVSTLTEWLTRTKTFDDALGLLWQAMIDSNGRVTIQVTAALKAESDAQALLPDNNSILQVVLYELAGDLTSDGLAIEAAKGQLATALSDLTGGMVVGQ